MRDVSVPLRFSAFQSGSKVAHGWLAGKCAKATPLMKKMHLITKEK
jgi:hypothetical protein